MKFYARNILNSWTSFFLKIKGVFSLSSNKKCYFCASMSSTKNGEFQVAADKKNKNKTNLMQWLHPGSQKLGISFNRTSILKN